MCCPWAVRQKQARWPWASHSPHAQVPASLHTPMSILPSLKFDSSMRTLCSVGGGVRRIGGSWGHGNSDDDEEEKEEVSLVGRWAMGGRVGE